MSPGEKSAWKSKTPQFTRVNSLGNPYELLGNQLFQGLNQNRVLGGESINEIAPDAAVFPVRNIIADTFDLQPVDITVFLDFNVVPIDHNFHFWASETTSSNRSLSFPNDYKLIRSYATGTYSQFDFSTEYRNNWGPGPTIQIGNSMTWYLQIILEALYVPSGEKSVIDSHTATVIQ
jgi:hypothetical protein